MCRGFSKREGADQWEEGITKEELDLMGQAGLSSKLLKDCKFKVGLDPGEVKDNQGNLARPYLKTKSEKEAARMWLLPNRYRALGSIPSSTTIIR